jgi:hypothetical protein
LSFIDVANTTFLSAKFHVVVSCVGCDDIEPLFLDSDPCQNDYDLDQCRRGLQELTLNAFSSKYEKNINEFFTAAFDVVISYASTGRPDGTII